VLLNLPFALIGGVFALAVTGQSLTLGAMVGLVTVFGISARNAILLLAHVEHLAEREPGNAVTPTLVRQAAQERLLPVVMTAIVTALGLVPLALGLGKAGNEIEAPLAIVVLGGLTTSTVLSLVVLPMLVMRALESRFANWLVPSAQIEKQD
jgi:Cu/Ag efflux pump CusA